CGASHVVCRCRARRPSTSGGPEDRARYPREDRTATYGGSPHHDRTVAPEASDRARQSRSLACRGLRWRSDRRIPRSSCESARRVPTADGAAELRLRANRGFPSKRGESSSYAWKCRCFRVVLASPTFVAALCG